MATGIVEEIVTRRKSKALWDKFQMWRTFRDLKLEDGEMDEEPPAPENEEYRE